MTDVWSQPMPEDPVMRRVFMWRAMAFLAACEKISLNQLLMCLVMDTFKPPSDEELRGMILQAKEAVEERQKTSGVEKVAD